MKWWTSCVYDENLFQIWRHPIDVSLTRSIPMGFLSPGDTECKPQTTDELEDFIHHEIVAILLDFEPNLSYTEFLGVPSRGVIIVGINKKKIKNK